MIFKTPLSALLLSATVLLSACESAEERAERHFQAGLALLEQGDEDRALVEFRNVFQLDGFHKEARRTYGDVLLRQGKTIEAYSQYLRLIEQYPDTPEVRRILAEIAIERGDWLEADRHGRAAIELDPLARGAQALEVALDYRAALLAREENRLPELIGKAESLLAAPETGTDVRSDQILRRMIIDSRMSGADPQSAMPVVEAAIAAEPDVLDFQMLKLRLLSQRNDVAALGAQLQQMAERFPDNETVRGALIAWYLERKDFAGAETFLRGLAGPDTGETGGHVAVIQLLQMTSSPEAAHAEADRLRTANAGTPNADFYAALLASMDFDAGRRTEAIAALETILQSATPSDQSRRIKVTQARMMEAEGNMVGARARIEEVLAEDAGQVDALKLRASWRIAADDPGGAITDLRTALNQAPRDPTILSLMAQAHEREGQRDLAAERLALAVEVSGNAPQESLRYARFLLQDKRTLAAITVLTDARRANPSNIEVLVALADVYLRESDWPRAEEIMTHLQSLPMPAAKTAAQQLQAALLLRQDRTADASAALEALARQGGSVGRQAISALLDSRIRAGHIDEAEAYLKALLDDSPDDPELLLMRAAIDIQKGDRARAEATYRALIAADPVAEVPIRQLHALLIADGRSDEASQVLQAALAAGSKSLPLRVGRAIELERAGQIDAALELYAAIYADHGDNMLVANNYSSLLSTYRDDAASLERAAAIAQRLRNTQIPAFADTYGWIEYRRGNLEEALRYLELAAQGLPDEALAQFHLGMTLAALGRGGDARKALQRALDLPWPDGAANRRKEAQDTLQGLAP